MAYDVVFELPSGEEKTYIRDNPHERFVGVAEVLDEDAPDWVKRPTVTKPYCSSSSAKGALTRRSPSGYFCNEQLRSVPYRNVRKVVIEAKRVELTRLYSGIIEHNTWECESWFWAFPSTDAVDEMLKKLEDSYRQGGHLCRGFEHHSGNIGRLKCHYTFKYGVDGRFDSVMENVYKGHQNLAGRYTRKRYHGGSYMGWFNELTETEVESLEAIQRAIVAISAGEPIYKGHPVRLRD